MRYAAALLLLLLPGCRASAPVTLPADLPLLTRAEWGAAAPVERMHRHSPRRITIHHTATRQAPQRSTADKLRALQRFSQQRSALADGRIKEPWADVPYHFYIGVDGVVAEGRALRFAGDSNTSYDLRGQIQIVLEGNFEEEQPSEAQFRSLWKLTWALVHQWRVAPEHIFGHKDHAPTACPGDVLYRWLPMMRDHLVEHL
jgi:N-acetyl-anhydromuramyl-L-alanine amidase AmpD